MWLLLAQANGADVGDLDAASKKFLPDEERETARAVVDRAVGRSLPRYWPGIESGEAEDWSERSGIALRWQECERFISILTGAVEAGKTEAELELARSHKYGTCVETDAAKALAHYEGAARSGDTSAILRLAFMHYDGRGATRDMRKARHWFKAAALDLVARTPRHDRRMERLKRTLRWSGGGLPFRAIPPELEAEIDWLSEIERGDPRILYETALRLRDGDGLPQHRDAAVTWLERAGYRGLPEGYYAAARMLLDEPDTSLNRWKGEDLLKLAARYGVAAAQKDLSLRELAGVEQIESYNNRPYAWLLLAEASGVDVSAAEFAAARDYLSEEARADARESVQWALGKAHLPTMWPTHRRDDDPFYVFDEDLRAALNWHECDRILSIIGNARQAGITAAEHELGLLHEEGTCVGQDATKAFDRYSAAVDGGAMQSALRLGLLYYDGRGVAQDSAAARFWFKAAALNLVPFTTPKERLDLVEFDMPRTDGYNHREPPPELMAELEWVAAIEGGGLQTLFETALRVRDGSGLPRVREAAIAWLSEAGYRGLPEAYHELGRLYLDAPIERRDVGDGVFYLAMAGRDGFVPAQVEMGRRYAGGEQLQQWSQAAYVWLSMARDNGADVAVLLDEVGGRLSGRERFTALEEAEKGTYYPLRSR